MQPKHKKTRRAGDLQYPWEYRGYMIRSGSRKMYNAVTWTADQDGRAIATAPSLKRLCIEIDKQEENNV